MFEGLNSPIPDAGKYLERIRFTRRILPDKETLDALITAHIRSVPFENIDIYDRDADICLDIGDLYNKIVVAGRGGYCFELNALFMSLLQNLGFKCYAVAARVLWRVNRYPLLSHRATIVTIDGGGYYCDVGFGGPSPDTSVCLSETGGQISGNNMFFVERKNGTATLSRISHEQKEPLIMFNDSPVESADFIPLNYYYSKNKSSYFKSCRMVNLRTDNGRLSIEGNCFKRKMGGISEEIIMTSDEQLADILSDYFGIRTDYRLRVNDDHKEK